MNCPACGRRLVPVDIAGLTVEVCQGGCAGMWFDRAELRSFVDPTRNAAQILIERSGQPQVTVDLTQTRRCPRCPDSLLMRHFFSAKRAVTVDECPTCAGIWLDAGELERIRAEYPSSAARAQAARAALEEVLAGDRMSLSRSQLRDTLPFDATRSRIVSSLLVAVYVGGGFAEGGAKSALMGLLRSLVPWACVCYPDALAGVISPLFGTTRASPRSFVWFFGWLVLLVPVIQMVITAAAAR